MVAKDCRLPLKLMLLGTGIAYFFLLIGCLSRNNWLEISICLIAIGMVVYWLFDELKKKK